MKSLTISYFLCAAGLFTPLAGLHRLYLEKPLTGILYLVTWGFFGIGTILDLIRMPSVVDDCNMRIAFSRQWQATIFSPRDKLSSPERAILKCANDHQGVVTIPLVSMYSGLSMSESKTELNRLFRHGFCQKDIDEEGNEIYIFKGLKPKKPLV